jgi:ferredoxin
LSLPRSRYMRLRSVISSSPRAEGALAATARPPARRRNRRRSPHSSTWARAAFPRASRHPGIVERDDAIMFGLGHAIGEDGGAFLAVVGAAQQVGQAVAVEDVVAQDQRARRAGQEVGADADAARRALRCRGGRCGSCRRGLTWSRLTMLAPWLPRMPAMTERARLVLDDDAQARGAAVRFVAPGEVDPVGIDAVGQRSQPIVWTSMPSPSRRRPTIRSPGIGWQHSARWKATPGVRPLIEMAGAAAAATPPPVEPGISASITPRRRSACSAIASISASSSWRLSA